MMTHWSWCNDQWSMISDDTWHMMRFFLVGWWCRYQQYQSCCMSKNSLTMIHISINFHFYTRSDGSACHVHAAITRYCYCHCFQKSGRWKKSSLSRSIPACRLRWTSSYMAVLVMRLLAWRPRPLAPTLFRRYLRYRLEHNHHKC